MCHIISIIVLFIPSEGINKLL